MNESTPLAREIHFKAREIINLAEKILSPYELTLEQFETLKSLSLETGVTQRQLGRIVNKNPANLTRILDRLAGKSYIIRQTDPDDRRACLIYLTAGGQELLNEVLTVFIEFSEKLHQGITPEMEQTTRRVLERITENLAAIELEITKK